MRAPPIPQLKPIAEASLTPSITVTKHSDSIATYQLAIGDFKSRYTGNTDDVPIQTIVRILGRDIGFQIVYAATKAAGITIKQE